MNAKLKASTHVFNQGGFMFGMTVTEFDDRIELATNSNGGTLIKRRDRRAFMRWFKPLWEPVLKDPRPLMWRDAHTGAGGVGWDAGGLGNGIWISPKKGE